jgi:hypothetical protein
MLAARTAPRVLSVGGVVWCVSDGKSRRLRERVHRRGKPESERGLPSASSFVSERRASMEWDGMDGIHACKLLHALITRRLPLPVCSSKQAAASRRGF